MLKIFDEKKLLSNAEVKSKIMMKLESLEKLVSNIGEPNELKAELIKTSYFAPSGRNYRCELNVRLPGKVLRVESEATDIIAAATDAKNKMGRLLKQYKQKHSQKVKKGMRKVKKREHAPKNS